MVAREAAKLRDLGRSRGVGVEFEQARIDAPALVQPELAERLLLRLTGTLVELADSGERLQVDVRTVAASARISVSRPAALRGIAESDLFDGGPPSSGPTGAFMLRLVRRLAHIAGGDLVGSRDSLALAFPRA